MADFPDICASNYNFVLAYNTQNFESPLTRSTQTASLTGDQWQAVVTYSNKTGADARTLKAFILGLKGQVGRFNFTPPDLDQQGTLLGTPVINGAGQLGTTISSSGWDGGQAVPIGISDYFTVNGELKTVTSDPVISDLIEYPGVTNNMPSPFDPEGYTGASDPDGTITNIVTANPSGVSFVGEVEQTDAGSMVINISSTLPVLTGETIYMCAIAKNVNMNGAVRFRFTDGDAASASDTVVRISDGVKVSGDNNPIKFTALSDGYSLIEVERDITQNDSTSSGRLVFIDADTNAIPSVGAKIRIQAAFYGISTDFPGRYLSVLDITFAPPLRRAPPDLAPLEVEKPFMIAKLENDDQTSFQVSSPIIYNASFSIVEVF